MSGDVEEKRCTIKLTEEKQEEQVTFDKYEITDNSVKQTTCISKKQLKKQARHEKWLQQKPIRRAKEKEKKREKQEAKEKGIILGPSKKYLKQVKMKDSSCSICIAFDVSLDELMTEAERSKCFKQLQHCYSMNRRAPAPLQLYITSFSGAIRENLSKYPGIVNWDVYFHEEDYIDCFGKDRVVYLTSESANIVEKLEDSKIYIIGGLVDHNRHKGLCYRKAIEKGISHARLPIDEFIKMQTRKVLTIDHVFEILLRVSEGKTWQEAFLSVLPQRKGAIPKEV
ncbi:LOW QUALITY PROTEIN: tRNA methyltransferase 10 homolog A-like [Limulus polyphemus]|uniref:tRNA (guanine(9)-N(1))-methyltransferase n=1 Tax=Limulus polyphemus TaxID=6850 RepID=A0ABM1BFY1_LIMPO|nr:LOW QUALITY PROTEIN: tRNA methyltransferase 10 homolog A-like [Limulus polyphemus]